MTATRKQKVAFNLTKNAYSRMCSSTLAPSRDLGSFVSSRETPLTSDGANGPATWACRLVELAGRRKLLGNGTPPPTAGFRLL
jgi:hypothetical protein